MTEQELQQLLDLFKKANEEGLIGIYNENEDIFEVDWVYADDSLRIKIKEF